MVIRTRKQRENVLDHISLGVSDLQRSIRFYDNVLGTLGYLRVWSDNDAAGYGPAGSDDALAIKREANGSGASQRFHVAFKAQSRQAVIGFYQIALSQGATPDGEPGLHPEYGDGYFAAFVLDPDGYRLEAVLHE